MRPQVIFQDKSFLVLDKPAGWIVNRANTTKSQNTVQDWLDKSSLPPHLPSASPSDFARRSGIVHRLDKDTSGLLLVAKTPEIFLALQTQFKDRQVRKTYICLVHGKLSPHQGQITAPVGRLPWHRTRFGILAGGRPAITNYQLKDYYQDSHSQHYSLINVSPQTGRTHQIRVHLKYLHHPIVGDSLYAGRKTARSDHLWCPRQFLHAHRISFSHPLTGKTVTFTSPLPSDLTSALHTLVKADTID